MNRIALVLAALLIVAAVGCGGRSEDRKDKSKPPPASPPAGTRTTTAGAATTHRQPTTAPAASQPDATIIGIIASQLGVERSRVTRRTTLADLEADDLDLVEIVMELEDTFQISIPDEQVDGLRSVGQIIDYVKGKLAGRPSAPRPAPRTRPDRP